jgi:hypothetical protein
MTNPYFFPNLFSANSAGQQGYPSWGSPDARPGVYQDPMADLQDPALFPQAPNQPNSQAMNMGGAALSGLTAGLTANPQYDSQWTADPWASARGAYQGASAGSAAGPVGALAGGIAGALGASIQQPFRVNKNIRNVNTSFNNLAYDAYGRPVYQGGEAVAKAMNDIAGLNKTMAWDSMNITGSRRRARNKKKQVLKNVETAQNNYNTAESDYRGQMNAREDYFDNMNMNNRMYNIYRSQSL